MNEPSVSVLLNWTLNWTVRVCFAFINHVWLNLCHISPTKLELSTVYFWCIQIGYYSMRVIMFGLSCGYASPESHSSAAVVVNIWEVPLGNFLSHLVFLLYSSHPLSAPNSAICYTFFPPPLCSALASSHPTPTSLSVSLHLPTTQSLQCLGMELSPQEWVRTLKGEGG